MVAEQSSSLSVGFGKGERSLRKANSVSSRVENSEESLQETEPVDEIKTFSGRTSQIPDNKIDGVGLSTNSGVQLHIM